MNEEQTKQIVVQVEIESDDYYNRQYPLPLPKEFRGKTFVAQKNAAGWWVLTEVFIGCTEDLTPEGWAWMQHAEFCNKPHFSRRTKNKMTVRIYLEEDGNWNVSMGDTNYPVKEGGYGYGKKGLDAAVVACRRIVESVGGWY